MNRILVLCLVAFLVAATVGCASSEGPVAKPSYDTKGNPSAVLSGAQLEPFLLSLGEFDNEGAWRKSEVAGVIAGMKQVAVNASHGGDVHLDFQGLHHNPILRVDREAEDLYRLTFILENKALGEAIARKLGEAQLRK